MEADNGARIRVLLNALSARVGGGQTYIKNLLEHLPEDAAVDVFVLAPDSLEIPTSHANIIRIPSLPLLENAIVRAAWEKIVLPKLVHRIRADVLFCPGGVVGSMPPRNCKVVTMFRNMIPFDQKQRKRYPLGYTRLRLRFLRGIFLRSMLRANMVIFVSDFGRQVVMGQLKRPLKKAVVIPHGVRSEFCPDQGIGQAAPTWIPREGYLLYVSTIDFYKAHRELVQGYALLRQLRNTTEKLVFVGAECRAYAREVRADIERLGLRNDVIVVGKVPYSELPGLYQHAQINLFASELENCPNILLEALAAGRPVLCSNRPPMPEFAGDAVAYFDPASPADIAAKMAAVLNSPARMCSLCNKAMEQARLHAWSVSAQRTWDALTVLCRP